MAQLDCLAAPPNGPYTLAASSSPTPSDIVPRLLTLGGLAVHNGTLINGVANPRSRLAILAALAVAGDRGMRREKLAALFWPDSDEERARSSLRQALFILKRDIGAGDITTGVSDVRLLAEVISADVIEFEAALQSGRFEEAASLYSGPFLDGVHVRESPELERWVEEQRSRLSSDYSRALERAAEMAGDRGDHRGAIGWLEKRVRHDPLSSRVARRYMEGLVKVGEREKAIQHAAAYSKLVRKELEAEPDPEVLRLASSIREAPAGAQPRVASPASSESPRDDLPGSAKGTATATTDRRFRSLTISVAFTLVVVAVFAMFALWGGRNATETTRPGRIAISTFVNLTGDSSLNDLGHLAALAITQRLQDAVTSDLAGPLVSTGMQLELASGSGSKGFLALARSQEAGFLVQGTISRNAAVMEFRAQLVDVRTEGVVANLDAVPVTAGSIEAGLASLRDQVAVATALALDGSRIPTGVARAPSNVEALRVYLEGLAMEHSGVGVRAYPAAAKHYMAAARLDTAYTAALVSAASVMSTLISYAREDQRVEWRRQRDSVLRALERRQDRLTRLDREALAFFAAVARGDVIAMRQSAELAASLSPGSDWSCHAAEIATEQGRFQEAVRFMSYVDFERGWARSNFNCWKYLLDPLHLLGDYAGEETAAGHYVRLNPQLRQGRARYTRALIGYGRVDEASRWAHDILASPGEVTAQAKQIAEEFQAHNEFERALVVLNTTLAWIHSPAFDRMIKAAGSDSSELRSAIFLREGALLYMAGRLAESRAAFTRFLPETPPSRPRLTICTACGWDVASVRAYLALIAAREGNRAVADSAIQALEGSESPPLAGGLSLYMAARIAAALGDRERAVRILTEALRNPDNSDLLLYVHRERDWFALRDDGPFRRLTAARTSP